MKEKMLNLLVCIIHVAPLVGAWIERCVPLGNENGKNVAPLVGAWIERQFMSGIMTEKSSRSSCRSVD